MNFNIEKDDLYKLYIEENKTVPEISKMFQTSTSSVNRKLKRFGIKKDISLRNKKISETIQSRTNEEKNEYSNKISSARKGKGLGVEPWNKGKHTGNAWSGKHHSTESKKKISKTKLNKTAEEKQIISNKLSDALTGRRPWNKGIPMSEESRLHLKRQYAELPEEIKKEYEKKRIASRRRHKTFNVSNLEKTFFEQLQKHFKTDDIKRQYTDELRYPFLCDFYIVSKDLFIEINGNWTHGFMPYDPENEDCKKQLLIWEEKAKTSEYYKNAIETWTIRDVNKLRTATTNQLNYVTLYTKQDMDNFLKTIEEQNDI